MPTREPPSRHPGASTTPPAARRSPSPPPFFRRPSPTLQETCFIASESFSSKRSTSAEKRPISSEKPRPWPSSMIADAKTSRILLRDADALWPSSNSLSSGSSTANEINGKFDHDRHNFINTLKPSTNSVERPLGAQQTKILERKYSLESKNGASDKIRNGENAKPSENPSPKLEQQRWPGQFIYAKKSSKGISRSLDLTLEKEVSLSRVASVSSFSGSRLQGVAKAFEPSSPSQIPRCRSLSRSTTEETFIARRKSFDGGKSTRYDLPKPREKLENQKVEKARPRKSNSTDFDYAVKESENALSAREASEQGNSKGSKRGTLVPARFWQEMASRFGRAPFNLAERIPRFDSESGSKTSRRRSKPAPSVVAASTGNSTVSFGPSPGRSPPHLSNAQPASPPIVNNNRSGQPFSPSRGSASPTKTRSSHFAFPLSFSFSGTRQSGVAGLLNPGLDARKARKGLNQQDDAQDLRILHNRWLQWRFVNARAEATLQEEQLVSENLLFNVWSSISVLRDSVAQKRARLQQERQALKLVSILSSHKTYLDAWEYLHPEHASAVNGVTEALEVAAMKIPAVGGAKIDIVGLKEALRSASLVMNSVNASVSKLLPKAEEMDSLVRVLAKTVMKERASLEECGDLLDFIAILETEECSLEGQFMQINSILQI